mgnify:CR=1 FL=1
MPGGTAGVSDTLSQLQGMMQLAELTLAASVFAVHGTPPAVFAVLTESSKLQRLDISCCVLPVGAWQHMFPAGRQLSHLHITMGQTGCFPE